VTPSSPLVSAEWLEEHLDDPNVIPVNVHEQLAGQELACIPGSAMWHWRHDLTCSPQRDIANPAELLDALGITSGHTLVLYSTSNQTYATWAYWILHMHGHTNMAVLDGSYQHWQLNGHPSVRVVAPASNATRAALHKAHRHPARTMLGDLRRPRRPIQLIDVRNFHEYDGTITSSVSGQPALNAGHIPGATHHPWRSTLQPDGRFHDTTTLSTHYSGLKPNHPSVVYCRIGLAASHTWFVLSQLLDWPHVSVYDGSWCEYGSLIAAPLNVGSTP